MKKGSVDYVYVSALSDDEIYAANKKCRILSLAAAGLFVPVLALFIFPGFSSLVWIKELYEANIAFTFLFFLYLFAAVWNGAQSFLSYRIRRTVKKSQAPFFGFEKMPYTGILCAVALGCAFFAFFTVIVIGGSISSGSFDTAGAVAALFAGASEALSVIYCVVSFRLNRNASLEEVPSGEQPEEQLREPSTRLYHNMFSLTEEEKELGKREFEGGEDGEN